MFNRYSRIVACGFAALALGACDHSNPEEIVTDSPDFATASTWSATATPVGSSTVRATLGLKVNLGFRMEPTITVTGAPNTTYQWRIFRGGDCSVNVQATTNTAGDGLVLIQTVQSYPDVTTNAQGTGTITRNMAGSIGDGEKYTVRLRLGQASTNFNGVNPISCGSLQKVSSP